MDLLYWLCERTESKKVIETGVAYGWSSLSLLLSLQHRNGKLISIDMPYPGRKTEKYVGIVIPENLSGYWELIRKPDLDVLPEIKKRIKSTFNLCHYDSDKSYAGRMSAYPILWELLKNGGFFISDDVSDNVAFKDFSQKVDREPIIVKFDNKFCGILEKSSD